MRFDFARPGTAAAALAILALAVGCSKSPTGPSDPGTSGGATAVVSVTVGGNLTVSAGATSQLTARAQKSNGAIEDVTGQATWNSSDPSVATVSAAGLLTSLKEGAASVTASFGAKTGTGAVRVTAALYEVTVVASAVDALSSCDDFFEGPANGEFALKTDVLLRDATVVAVHSTESYPGDPVTPVYWNVAGGGSRTINVRTTFTLPGDASEFAAVRFRATEWDTLLVSTGPGLWAHDTRMNDRSTSRNHQFTNGALSGQGLNTLTLGDAACGIRLNYTISSARK